ncbi:hypothetical protein SAMN04487983_104958 [Streptomyces sp. yr375]|uniref:hypothetical protein n=1 Tax=Streptomyces sp. yr375 TaxID=1761906 RepID=UPI0008B67EBB|nr:hypothetical protein [Streptomyces sp. yr375]SES40509.1 hypothetical protein SAMN04487983_104958 [Streptomyces sp. yr375]
MQRKAYVPGVVVLLAALLAGCTGGSDEGGSTDNSNPGEPGTSTAAAQPGKYTTLPEACGVVSHSTLDSLLPGIKQLADGTQRTAAYAGEATLTYDTDRKVGCRWKVESTTATDHLSIDFERVVSYDNAVSDDTQAEALFAKQVTAADLPVPVASTTTPSGTASGTTSPSPSPSTSPSASASASPSTSASPSPTSTVPAADLQPRVLDDLGDDAFLDDALSSSGSTAKQRTVTVAFRTSNVIVTIEYEEQPATVGVVPDSEEMQDKARKLAAQLADSLAG